MPGKAKLGCCIYVIGAERKREREENGRDGEERKLFEIVFGYLAVFPQNKLKVNKRINEK